MSAGVLSREVEWETSRGRRLLDPLAPARLARGSPPRRVRLRGPRARRARRVTISSELVTHGGGEGADDPRRGKGFAEKVLEPIAAHAVGRRAVLQLATRNSGLEMACGMEHHVEASSPVTVEASADGDGARVAVRAELQPAGRCGCPSMSPTTGAPGAGRRPRGARRPDARPGAPRRLRAIEAQHRRQSPTSGAAATSSSRRPRPAAQRALQPLPAHAGDRAQRGSRRARQGRDRPRLRGPLLLGHRDLRPPVPHHTTPLGEPGARLPRRDARRGPRRAREVGHAGALYPWRTITGRRRPRSTQPAPRSTTSTPTSPTACTSTPGHRRPRVRARPGRRGDDRDRPAAGWSSASSPSAATGASASTA